MHSHRSTLKQQNKKFKSKKSFNQKTKGKVNKKSTLSKPMSKSITKTKSITKKKSKIIKQVAIVCLCPDVDTNWLPNFIGKESIYSEFGFVNLCIEKTDIAFIPTTRNIIQVLDACKVADMVLFVLSAVQEVDEFGEKLMSLIKTQGVPNVISLVQHLEMVEERKRKDVRKSLLYYMSHHFADEIKLYSVSDRDECLKCIRQITCQTPKGIAWRDKVPYLSAQNWEFLKTSEESGTLSITGYARGGKFHANRLAHIPELGNFQISRILAAPLLPHGEVLMEEQVLMEADPEQRESLVDQNIPDPMDAEQTWPTEEEIAQANQLVKEKKKLKRVPKGTSAYQAAWILEDYEDGEEVNSDEDSPMNLGSGVDGSDSGINTESGVLNLGVDGFNLESGINSESGVMNLGVDGINLESGINSESESEEEYEWIEMDDRAANFDALGEEENAQELKEYLEKQKQAREEQEFPDEVDTPQFMPAYQRFSRYRGLKSFRQTPWDPYENLPLDYSRIFQFGNFKRSKKAAMDAMAEGIEEGTRITIEIINVPVKMNDYSKDSLLTVFGLRPHEHKISVMNFTVSRDKGFTEPVKSKDEMILMVGFRRYVVSPIYSTYTRGGPNNVHKFERFLQPGGVSMATIYAPIQYGPAPVLMFKYSPNCAWDINQSPRLVGTGNLLDPQPLRIIAKRIILTGHPYKIHKRGAVVRFMFHSPKDIEYFKPVQIYTKYGCTGHIKESLGTHGYMKCQFDKGIKQHDTVCMNLYKRVYPKWTTRLFTINEAKLEDQDSEMVL